MGMNYVELSEPTVPLAAVNTCYYMMALDLQSNFTIQAFETPTTPVAHYKFMFWGPFNETEFNQMITTLSGAGVISMETAIEVNTISKPDEKQRIRKETEDAEKKALEQQEATLKMQAEVNKSNEQNKGEQE